VRQHARLTQRKQQLAPLPASHRDIITLRIAGHEVNEIASQTGRAKRTVERILQEFRKSLEGVLHESI
jgi:DNA-directed RNA polymerase specialized sigma24 family protein